MKVKKCSNCLKNVSNLKHFCRNVLHGMAVMIKVPTTPLSSSATNALFVKGLNWMLDVSKVSHLLIANEILFVNISNFYELKRKLQHDVCCSTFGYLR